MAKQYRWSLLSISVIIIIIITFLTLSTTSILSSTNTTYGGHGIGKGKNADQSINGIEATNDINYNLGEIFAFLAFYSMIMMFITGIPKFQRYISKNTKFKSSNIALMHRDLGYVTMSMVYLHLLFLSLTEKWMEYFSYWEIYPKIFYPLGDITSINYSLSLGFIAGFIMLLASIFGVLRKLFYKKWGKGILVYVQDITVISIILVTLHALYIGKLLKRNTTLQIIIIILVVTILIYWTYYKIDRHITIKRKKQRYITHYQITN